ALILPVLVLLLFGAIELARYVLFNQKLESVTSIAADAIARWDTDVATCANLGYGAYGAVMVWGMQPTYDFANNGAMIVSAVEHRAVGINGHELVVVWQSKWPQGAGYASRVGNVGQAPTGSSWPSHFNATPGSVMFIGDRAVVVEVFYRYDYFLNSFGFTDGVSYKRSIFRPRFGKLGQLQSGCGACDASRGACG
ncbi:MAG: TadE/TadG family type IV pilus assembly protein, partial [Rickettsiales bacterium]